jgi:hypothetical protein
MGLQASAIMTSELALSPRRTKRSLSQWDKIVHDLDEPSPDKRVVSYMLMSFGDFYGPYDLNTVRSMIDKGLPRHTPMTVVIGG